MYIPYNSTLYRGLIQCILPTHIYQIIYLYSTYRVLDILLVIVKPCYGQAKII